MIPIPTQNKMLGGLEVKQVHTRRSKNIQKNAQIRPHFYW